nr:hypothetical protein [Secundilactobacillus collinoides]
MELFNDYPTVKVLINNVIAADRLLKQGLLPQTLPELLLPDNIQDTIFKTVNETYPAGDPRGDKVWNELSGALPDLDQQLRGFRDYLEDEYGMWLTSQPRLPSTCRIHQRPTNAGSDGR